MRFLHIAYENEYTVKFYNLIASKYTPEEQVFVFLKPTYVGKEVIELTNLDHMIFRNEEFSVSILLNLIKNRDFLIIHSLSNSTIVKLLYENKSLLSRSALIIWGSDFYNLIQGRNTFLQKILRMKGIRTKFKYARKNIYQSLSLGIAIFRYSDYDLMKIIILKEIANIITHIDRDYNLIEKLTRTKAKHLYGFYPLFNDPADSKKNFSNKLNSSINIMIGNSATKSNQHFKIFNTLFKFKPNVFIHCPLSYGNSEYANTISLYGTSKFGDKFLPILDYINYEGFLKYLNRLDCIIMIQKRQQALGTIYSALLLGKLIVLLEGSPNAYHMDKMGIFYITFKKFKKLSLNELKILTYNKKLQNNINIIKELFSYTAFYYKWRILFELIKTNH